MFMVYVEMYGIFDIKVDFNLQNVCITLIKYYLI